MPRQLAKTCRFQPRSQNHSEETKACPSFLAVAQKGEKVLPLEAAPLLGRRSRRTASATVSRTQLKFPNPLRSRCQFEYRSGLSLAVLRFVSFQ